MPGTRQIQHRLFQDSKASNSKVNMPIWLEFELVQDFMLVLVTPNCYEDPIKNEGNIVSITFSPLCKTFSPLCKTFLVLKRK